MIESIPKNIIVKMPNWIGDAVMATPVLADLKRAFDGVKITALGLPHIVELIKKDPNVDEEIRYENQSGWIRRAEHDGVIRDLQKGRYDAGILLTNSFSSAWWFWRGGVQNKVGFKGGFRSWLLDAAVPFPKDLEERHLVEVYKLLLEPFGIPVSNTKPKLYLSPEDQQYQENFLKLNGIEEDSVLIGINPGASYGSAKCWLPERFSAVAKRLLDDPRVVVVFFGDEGTKELIQGICKGMGSRVVNMAAKTTLRELMALIAKCRVFLTNDSGPMHIASAFKIPLVALFGSTNDVKTGPYNGGSVINKKAACSPCYKRQCPIDFRCMTSISEDEVYKKLKELI